MPTNKELEQRVKALEAELAVREAGSAADPEVSAEQFYDLLAGIMEALVRSRSQGAWRVAEALRDKYLDPELDLQTFGEQYTTTSSLISGGGE